MPETDPSYFKSEIPENRSGDWVLERFSVAGDPSYDPGRDERPDFAKRRPGTYTLLRRRDTQFMTDLYDEWWTQRVVLEEATRRGGHLLISGLGLGMIVESIFKTPDLEVEGITVLELSTDVITLVAPHLEARYGDRLKILEADAFTWTPPAGARYTVVWHDIWPSPFGVEDEMATLRRRYGQWSDWIGFWPEQHEIAYSEVPTARAAG